ncbi:hypothetical protein CDAR_47091 [Caerostris darwini]|uniref:Uncharacterized protein n=1 Tax=Caerostris darwini TaxID=1538125 RepID=A0AAV4UA66_9ARAC|nr:hypothetical protein CDAR_47091 [Caerostris darwini]
MNKCLFKPTASVKCKIHAASDQRPPFTNTKPRLVFLISFALVIEREAPEHVRLPHSIHGRECHLFNSFLLHNAGRETLATSHLQSNQNPFTAFVLFCSPPLPLKRLE